MKISQPSADELIVSDFPVFTGGLSALFFVLFVGACLRASAAHPVNIKKLIGPGLGALVAGIGAAIKKLIGPGLGALVAGIGAAYLLKRSVIHFDRRIGQVTWTRQGILGTQTGQMSFSDIKDVIVEILSDTHGSTYRVTLLTTTDRWPLTDYYSGNRAASDKVKDALRAFLGFPAQPAAVSLDERLRSLIVSGQTLEAIKLVRLERNLSLKEAKEFVENLARTT